MACVRAVKHLGYECVNWWNRSLVLSGHHMFHRHQAVVRMFGDHCWIPQKQKVGVRGIGCHSGGSAVDSVLEQGSRTCGRSQHKGIRKLACLEPRVTFCKAIFLLPLASLRSIVPQCGGRHCNRWAVQRVGLQAATLFEADCHGDIPV